MLRINTLEQLLALYTDPESHNAQRYRQTDRQQDDANSRSYCIAVRSAMYVTVRFSALEDCGGSIQSSNTTSSAVVLVE